MKQIFVTDFQKFFFYLFLFPALLSAQTNLSGNLSGITLEKEGNPFIVTENITIPSGKQVTIKEGCVFLFNPFTGIIVEGSLKVSGTRENPVVFTSINDSAYNPGTQQLTPEAFDWNGIHFKTRARNIELRDFIITYSVYGIKSQIEDVILTRGTFSNNGQFHFTINDVIQPVIDDIPFTFGAQPKSEKKTVSSPQKIKRAWRRPAAITSTASAAAASAAVIYSLIRKHEYDDRYHDVNNIDNDFDYLTSRRQTFLNYAVISGVAGGTLLATGITLFILDHRTKKIADISFAPYFGKVNGIVLTFQL